MHALYTNHNVNTYNYVPSISYEFGCSRVYILCANEADLYGDKELLAGLNGSIICIYGTVFFFVQIQMKKSIYFSQIGT